MSAAWHPWSLTFSWGVCEFDHQQNDLQRWLQIVDEKISAMKQQYAVGH